MFRENGPVLHFSAPKGKLISPSWSLIRAHPARKSKHRADDVLVSLAGTLTHFALSPVHGATGSNTFAIYGQGVDKDLTELVPGVLNQLGPDAMANLKRLAESFQSSQGAAGAAVPEGVEAAGEDEAGDDEVPELVEAEATAEPVSRLCGGVGARRERSRDTDMLSFLFTDWRQDRGDRKQCHFSCTRQDARARLTTSHASLRVAQN